MALRDEHPLFEVTAQFAQLLLDHRDELDDYQDELRRLGYWILFGKLTLESPRLYTCSCQPQEQQSWSPVAALFSERSTPELLCFSPSFLTTSQLILKPLFLLSPSLPPGLRLHLRAGILVEAATVTTATR